MKREKMRRVVREIDTKEWEKELEEKSHISKVVEVVYLLFFILLEIAQIKAMTVT